MSQAVYLDYNATTPVAEEVADAVDRATRTLWGNPSSVHVYGVAARDAVDRSRAQVAGLIGCAPEELIFTSGGTESDNAAIVGVAEALADRGKHLVISAVEHAAIDRACRYLETRGFSVSRVGVDPLGRVDLAELESSLRPDTILVSVMHAQNETGVIQPVQQIGRLARARSIPFHTDAAQSAGKMKLDVDQLGCDLLTLAGHKLYGPKGVGALYLRRGVPFAGLLRGAPHESGRRAGTENVPAIVGLGVACQLAANALPGRTEHLQALRDGLDERLRHAIPDRVVHGEDAERLPNTLSVAFPGAPAVEVAARAVGVATAAGAACHSGKPHVSPVLAAMGIPDDLALATLRLSVGSPTTEAQIDVASEVLIDAIRRVRDSRSATTRDATPSGPAKERTSNRRP